MEEKKKNTTPLWIVIVLLVGGLGFLGGYIVFNKPSNECKESNEVKQDAKKTDNEENKNDLTDCAEIKETYTYETIAGNFETEVEYKDAEGKNVKSKMTLNLYNDGTFSYRYYGQVAGQGIVGNYIIQNNILELNELLSTTSSTSVYPSKGTKKIVINSNDELVDNVAPLVDETGIKLVTFKRTNKKDNTNEFQSYFYGGLSEYYEQ